MLLIKVRKTGPTAGLTRRELSAAAKAVYAAMGVFWHANFRKKHFTRAGAREYGYAERETWSPGRRSFERSYTGRKLARYGHTLPLVKSGESMRLTRIRDVRSTSKGGRVVLHARTFNRRNKFSQIDMRAEMTAVSAAEESQMAAEGDGQMQKQIDSVRRQQTTTPK